MKNLSLIGLLFCLLICSCQHKTDGLLTFKMNRPENWNLSAPDRLIRIKNCRLMR